MAKAREITDYERAFFELEKIRQQVDNLSEFLLSKIKQDRDDGQRPKTLLDPRTGEPFSARK